MMSCQQSTMNHTMKLEAPRSYSKYLVSFADEQHQCFEHQSDAVQIPFLVRQCLSNYHIAFSELNFDEQMLNFLAHGQIYTNQWTDNHNECLVKVFRNYHNFMPKFANKCYMFRSLSNNDQNMLLTLNSGMFPMYIIARYFTASSGIDQLSTICGPISPMFGKFVEVHFCSKASVYRCYQYHESKL